MGFYGAYSKCPSPTAARMTYMFGPYRPYTLGETHEQVEDYRSNITNIAQGIQLIFISKWGFITHIYIFAFLEGEWFSKCLVYPCCGMWLSSVGQRIYPLWIRPGESNTPEEGKHQWTEPTALSLIQDSYPSNLIYKDNDFGRTNHFEFSHLSFICSVQISTF